jgi:cytochrome c551
MLYLLLLACPTPQDSAKPDSSTDSPAESVADSVDSQPQDSEGAALYESICSHCHGVDGKGSNNGPDITGDVSRNSEERLVAVILNGEGRMPPQSVSEEEALAIVQWMKANF